MGSDNRKRIEKLVRIAEEAGWTVTKTRAGHFRFQAPDGVGLYFAPSTPSEYNSVKNTVSDLRKLGLDVA